MALDKLRIIRPYTATSAIVSTGSGAANLLTPDPKEVWTASGTGPQSCQLDLGAPRLVDAVYLGNTNLPPGAAVAVFLSLNTDLSDQTFFADLRVPPPATPGSPVNLPLFGTPKFARYVDVVLVLPGTVILRAGNLLAGKAFTTAYGHEWGSGRGLIDTGAKERLASGGFGLSGGAVKGSYAWTFGDLIDSEVQNLYALANDRGEGKPVVIVEAGESANLFFTATANTTIGADATFGNTATKSSGADATWNAAAQTTAALSNGVFVAGMAHQTTANALFGLSAIPGASVLSFETGIYFNPSGVLNYYNGTGSIAAGSYTTSDIFAVDQFGDRMRAFKNGEVIFERTVDPTVPYYGKFAGYDSSARINALSFHQSGLIERTHYGLFDRLDKYERLAPGATRWGLSIEEWV